MLSDICSWDETRIILNELREQCICFVCKNVSRNPLEYECGHFFCDGCVNWSRNACPVCGVPSHASEIVPDRCISTCIEVLNSFESFLSPDGVTGGAVVNNQMSQNIKEVKPLPSQEPSVNSQGSSLSSAVKTFSGKHSTEDTEDLLQSIEAGTEHKTLKTTIKASNTIQNIEEEKKAVNGEHSRQRSASRGRKNSKGKRGTSKHRDEFNTPSPAATAGRRSKKFQSPKTIPANDKRNKKGETPLQIACIKGDVDSVRKLLSEGASPNTKDFAGWTPLHEAVQLGNFTITEMLLNSGAVVNATGAGNMTALHEAVESNNSLIVKLLVSHGACVNARNLRGISPSELAHSEEVRAALCEKVQFECLPGEENIPPLDPQQVVIMACDLSKEQENIFKKFIKKFYFRVVNNYSEQDVTAVVTSTAFNNCCVPSLPVLCGILQGKWILSFDWIEKCMIENKLIDHKPFEVEGTINCPQSKAPKRGRINTYKQLPSLFSGCHIYLMHNGTYSINGVNMNKRDINTIIQMGDGTLLYREPNPESIPDNECTVPFHAKADGPLAKCSHYIIYKSGKTEPVLKYNMEHIKTLSAEWLIGCAEKFDLNLI